MRESSSPRGATVLPAAGAALSKTEALRQAIAALGYRAAVTEILEYVRDHFGIGEPAVVGSPPPPGEGASRPASKRGKNKDRADPSE